jgi:hypothetical protein
MQVKCGPGNEFCLMSFSIVAPHQKCKGAGQRGAPRYLRSPIHGAPNINANSRRNKHQCEEE